MNDQIHSIFESSLRVTSAPVNSTRSTGRSKSPGRRQSAKMNGIFEIPIETERTNKSSRTNRSRSASSKTPRPAWSVVQPKFSASSTTKKPASAPKPKPKQTEDFSKTKTIRKSPLNSPRISVSQSFHIKNPELIDSIVATENQSRSPSEYNSLYSNTSNRNDSFKNEFDRRDSSAAKIQVWWRARQQRQETMEQQKSPIPTTSIESIDKRSLVEDREKIRKKLEKRSYVNSSRIKSARENTSKSKLYISELPVQPQTSRPYDERIDDIEQNNVKFSARIQSSRRRKSTGKSPSIGTEPTPESMLSPRSIGSSPSSGSPPNEKENQSIDYQPALYKETKNNDNLSSLLTALGELERPKNPLQNTKQSTTDLKLAELEASLREIENSKKVKFKDSHNIEILHMKGVENSKMMNMIIDEKSIQSDHLEHQVKLLHSALQQQKDEHIRQMKEMEDRVGQERKLIIENNTTQNSRQLSFIDQLIKDKQSLAEQLTLLAKKVESDERKRKQKQDEMQEKHTLEINNMRDKLTAAEKIRREKWVEAKQKEIKALTVKGLEPEIARLIARHKQELRNLKSEHEAEIMAADERASRRWADQAERMRQTHEEEKIKITEAERVRAREKIQKELNQIESDAAITRERLNQERAIEKERQHQHIEYLKETNQNQITALTARHNENIKSLNAEWQMKFDDVVEKTALEIKIEKEKFVQKMEKFQLSLETENSTKLAHLQQELREKVKIERDKEIERAVDRIEKEMESVRNQSEEASMSKVRRIQEKMQNEIDLAEKNEAEMQKKYSDAKTKANVMTEELIAEKHKANLLAADLIEKDQRLQKLMSERERVSDVIREEFADRIVKGEKDLQKAKNEMAEAESRHKAEYLDLKREREEELAALNDRVHKALRQRDEEITRTTEVAEQAQRRADYMEEMLDKQNKLLRERKLKK